MVDTERDGNEVIALRERIEDYRTLAYNWRCFGDAVAFLFMDKFALKQTYYNTNNTNPKPDAGFIIGKTGLQLELSILDNRQWSLSLNTSPGQVHTTMQAILMPEDPI